jgi:FSR family fosmidomycin resistance protein-like MFS transporter
MSERTAGTVVPVLAAISFSHLLNDTIQSLLPAIYPILKDSYALSFAQIGLITLTLNVTACCSRWSGSIPISARRPIPSSSA